MHYDDDSTVILLGAGGFANEIREWISKSIMYADPEYKDGRKEVIHGLAFLSDPFLVATGDPGLNKRMFDKAFLSGLKPSPPFVSSRASLSPSARLGFATIVCPNAVVSTNAVVGMGCVINQQAHVAHDVTLGDFCVVSPMSCIGGGCEIGNGVFIGLGASIKPKIKIGDGAYIGMGAVVCKDVEPHSVVIGSPARAIVKTVIE